jgi:hypothetical protein
MGNVMSEEDEEQFLEDGFNLESPGADKAINFGTAAPVWQNTEDYANDEGQEVVVERLNNSNSASETTNSSGSDEPNTNSSRRGQQQQQPINPKKMSYIQMAKLGYQELVNAIIRPPRADYKVRKNERGLFG